MWKVYVGTDVASEMIKIAKTKLVDAPQNLSFEVQDAQTIQKGQHDVILALNVLHLLPALEAFLENVYTVLPAGGLLLSKTPLLRDGFWLLPWAIPVMRAIGKAPYVRVLRREELLNLFESAGFVVTETLVQDGMVPRIFIVAQKP